MLDYAPLVECFSTKVHKSWIIILFMLIGGFVVISFIRYDLSDRYVGLVHENGIEILAKEDDLVRFPDYFFVDNVKYNYKMEVGDYYLDNNVRYRSVIMLSDLKSIKSVVDIKIVYGQTYLLKEILKIIKGGVK